jgi:hypothetical protein
LSTANDRYAMFIALGAAEADDAGADDAADAVAVAAGALLLELLQAASPRAAAATAATAALRPRDRVAGKEGTAKLLCARSLGGGLADSPVGRVPARLTGFLLGSARCDHPRLAGPSGSYRHKTSTPRRDASPARGTPGNGLMSATRSLELDRKRVCFFGGCQEPTVALGANET